jgi:hypothetical protein
MDRLPERMVILPVPPAGPLFVFIGKVGMERRSGPLRCGPIAVASG